MKFDIPKLKKWIFLNKDQFIDDCNEYNYTGIAEALADAHQLYIDDNGTIPEDVFDLVVNVLT